MPRPLKVAFVVVDDRFTRSAPLPFFGAAPTALLQGFEELDGEVEIHIVCCTMGEHPRPEKLGKNIWFHAESVPKWGYLRTLHWGCHRAVRRMIQKIQPDIIHAQGTERWCAITSAMLPYPKILTIHGNLAEIDPQVKPKPRAYWKLQTLLQKIAVPRFDGVFCNSDYTEQCIRPAARKTWRVDNPVRKDFFATIQRTKEPSPPVLLNVGVFQERKRQFELLQLAKMLFEQDVRVLFRLIGRLSDDEYGRQCKPLIEEGERAGYVEYAGLKTARELASEMDHAQGFVHCPSEEAFGLVVAESLARGQKFFGSAVGGIVDITRDVAGCELYEKDDWMGMAKGIARWVADGAPRQPRTMKMMAGRYAPRVVASQHLCIYQALLAEKSVVSGQ